MKIDLSDNIFDSKFFSWGEALWLPRWGIAAFPHDKKIIANIEKTAVRMDMIRDFFDCQIQVTNWYRPEKYNSLIGGATKSAHLQGLAVDFIVRGIASTNARKLLRQKLFAFNLRMEGLETAHVHIDLMCEPDMSLEKRVFFP